MSFCTSCVHSCGEIYHESDEVPLSGELASLTVDQTGTNNIRIVSDRFRVSNVIGRSVVVSSNNSRY
jgi:Cu/Zn superoxide dismutase